MKKLIVAAAVSAALIAPAMAQNVSVYGVIGMSYDQVELSGVSRTSSTSRDPLASNRIGLKGTEDLGGGMSLSFTLEGDLNTTNGTGDGTGALGGIMFDRAAFIDLNTGMGFNVQAGKFANSTKRFDSAASAGTNLLDMATFLYSTDTSGMIGVSGKAGSVDFWATYSNDITPTVASTTGIQINDGSFSESGFGLGTTIGGVALKIGQTARGAGTEMVALATAKVSDVTVEGLVARTDTGAANGKTGNMQASVTYPVSGLNLRGTVGRHTSDVKTAEYKYMGFLVDKPLSKRTSVFTGWTDKDVNNGSTGDETVATVGIVHSF